MGSNTVEFYTNPQSRGRIIRWMLEELEITYETKILTFGKQMKTEPYIAINPMGKVPAIVHNGNVVTECAAICAYLADAFSHKSLAPPIDSRASYYRWLFFAAGPLEAAVSNRALGIDVPADKQGTVGYGNFDTTIDTLAKAVIKNPYIAGQEFTSADVYVGSQIGWGLQFGTLPEKQEFIDYFAKLKTRPACLRAQELDNALI